MTPAQRLKCYEYAWQAIDQGDSRWGFYIHICPLLKHYAKEQKWLIPDIDTQIADHFPELIAQKPVCPGGPARSLAMCSGKQFCTIV